VAEPGGRRPLIVRLVRYLHDGESLSGVAVGDTVHAVSGVSLPHLVAAGVITATDTLTQVRPEVVALDAVELLAPLPVPPSIRDFMAFEQHVEGMGLLVGADPLVPDVWYEQPPTPSPIRP
jgi:hypothetical protein